MGYWLPRGLALLAVVIAPLPLALDLKLGIAMASTGRFLWSLSVLLVVATVLIAKRNHDQTLLRTMFVAFLAGMIATSTYDTFRLAGLSAGVSHMDEAFDFGQRLTGQIAAGVMNDAPGDQMNDAMSSENKPAAQNNLGMVTLLGYLYHFWNGTMFSLAFLVLFGIRRWWLAVPFMVLIIYSGMAIVMGTHSLSNFILEALGHAAFGITLGAVSWAYLRGNNQL